MWTEAERQQIESSVNNSWDRVKRLKISPEFVLKRLPHEYPELYSKTMKIEDELTPKVPFNKAMSMIAAWELSWKQIEMKVKKRKPNAKR